MARKQTPQEELKKVTAKNNGSKLVKFKFKNYEVRGGDLTFFYGDEDTPDASYHFQDGGIYEAPYSVAEKIHYNTSYPVHRYKQDEDGKFVVRVGETVQRYGIIPINFMFQREEPSNLVTVESLSTGYQNMSV